MSIEAMKQALEALEYGGLLKKKQAITSLRQALSEAQLSVNENSHAIEQAEKSAHESELMMNDHNYRQKFLEKQDVEQSSTESKETFDQPVAYVETKEVHGQMCSFIYRADSTSLLPDGSRLYTTPQPQREWVGLTYEEINDCDPQEDCWGLHGVARAIEAKLKEKNQ